ncbi:hypothetical protein [Arenimonas sp.]|uniref:hypothetical protein n=1 Tax=Arenimonas sp. TaxID=1872635 RepID=UPI0039E3D97F
MPLRALLPIFLLAGAAGAADVDILPTGEALQRWQPIGKLAAPPAPPGDAVDTCVNLGFLVDRNGATSSFALLRGWSADTGRLDEYMRHSAAAVQSWRFQAADSNGKRRPVYTHASFVFLADAGGDAAAVRARCDVGDLRSYVEQAYGRNYRRGNLGKGQLEHNRQQYPWQIPDGCTRHAGWCD